MQKMKRRVEAGCRGSTVSPTMHFPRPLSSCQFTALLHPKAAGFAGKWLPVPSKATCFFFNPAEEKNGVLSPKSPFLVLHWLMSTLMGDKRNGITLNDLD